MKPAVYKLEGTKDQHKYQVEQLKSVIVFGWVAFFIQSSQLTFSADSVQDSASRVIL
jgi:hypothetical protein